MPANDNLSGRVCYHVYNRGIENRSIFSDDQDFDVFISYLKEYLTPQSDPESVKKEFIVKGKTFRGTPHQPKNYFGRIELISYSLMPDHFHLLLNQKEDGSIENFIRSLCTRYSMYFNKKYERKGSLFEGPYKSVKITNPAYLWPLTQYIHHGQNDHSTNPEYSGNRQAEWVNTAIIMAEQGNNSKFDSSELPDDIKIEKPNQPLVRRDLAQTTRKTDSVITKKGQNHRFPEMAAIVAVFFILLTLGLRNVSNYSPKNIAIQTTQGPTVLSEFTKGPPIPTVAPITGPKVVVKVSENVSVNIRELPSSDAKPIAKAKNGDSFEFISESSGWYEIKLIDGSKGFISTQVSILEQNIQ